MDPRCFQIHPSDNVATLLDRAGPGLIRLLNAPPMTDLIAIEPITLGHKIALRDIDAGQVILKYGIPIGIACVKIPRGAWVHLHNCQSQFDQRSGTLDLHSGAATDVVYE